MSADAAPADETAVYFVVTYVCKTDDESKAKFAKYMAGVMPLAAAKEVEFVSGDFHSEWIESAEKRDNTVTVIAKYRNRAHCDSFYKSPEYQALLPLRLESTISHGAVITRGGFHP